MEPAEILAFLETYSDWLSHATFWRNIGQMILFGLLRFFYRVAVFAEELIDAILLARGFLQHETITTIFDSMLIFTVSLTTLTLIIIAVRKLINPKVDLKSPFIRGFFTVALIGSMPGLLVRGLEISVNTFEHARVLGTEEHTSISMAIIRENVADMHFIASHERGFDVLNENTTIKNSLNEISIWHVDFGEVITPDDISSGSILHPLMYTTSLDSDGELGVTRIRNRWLDLFDEGYFRWTADWGVLYTTMPLITLFMFCTAFVLLTTLLDLIFLKIVVPILAPVDVETGQKMKHIAKDAGASMLSIVLIGVSLSVFRILLGFIFELDINFVARLIYLAVAVTICMKGSTAFGKYLGIDVGMGNGLKSMLKLGALGITAAKLGTGGAKATKKGVEVVQNGVPKAIEGAKKLNEGAKKVVGNTSEAIGQVGTEFAGLGAKDFMRTKAINAGDSLKEGITNANPIPKMKTAFNENIGDNFKEGVMKGDAKVMDSSRKLKNRDAQKARAKKVKQFDPQTPLPKFGEAREVDSNSRNHYSQDKPIDIFKGEEISLSDDISIVESTESPKKPDVDFTLPQFGETAIPKANHEAPRSNPFDEVKGVAAESTSVVVEKAGKTNKKVAPKIKNATPKNSSPATVELPPPNIGTVNDLTRDKKNPVPNTPKVSNAPTNSTKKPNSNIGITKQPAINAPRKISTEVVPSLPKVDSKMDMPIQNIPKQTTNNKFEKNEKVEDIDEE